MTFSFNPITDSKYLTTPFTWKSYVINPGDVAKSQLKYEFLGISKIATQTTTKKHIAKLVGGKEKTLFMEFCSLSLDCIICYKNGNREWARWDHVFKGDVIFLNQLPLSKVKTSNIERIVLIDELNYHDELRQFWAEGGFSYLQSMEERDNLKQRLIEEL